MRKIFFSVNHSGCAWWRSRQPANMIKKHNLAELEIFSQYDTIPSELNGILRWCDTIVSQSPAGIDSIALTLQYQKMGKVVIADYDDLVYSCSPFNPAYKTLGLQDVKVRDVEGKEHWLWEDGVKGFSIKDNYVRYRAQQDLFKIIDGVSVTNQYLKNRYLEENPDLEGKIEILPNSIDFRLFRPFPKKKNEKVRIGWFASSSHLTEIWVVKSVILKLYERFGDKIQFVLLGDIPELSRVFSADKMELHPFVDLNIYPLKAASLNLDIGICPLVDDEFNRHKSQLKWSEYAALGIPSVCSKIEPYECVEDGKTGYLAKDNDEFADKVSLLVESEKLRKEIADNAYEKNYNDFNLEKNINKWVDFYQSVYDRVWEDR